ncbi:MAG: hypothetical protein ACREQ7_00115 [Candidatus Binatia bacterium]
MFVEIVNLWSEREKHEFTGQYAGDGRLPPHAVSRYDRRVFHLS